MTVSLSIPARFNGPVDSGNGGYCAGAIAALVDGPVAVSLRAPVPLDMSLDVATDADGAVHVTQGGALVAEAHAAPQVDLDVPEPVGVEEARAAMANYRGLDTGVFRCCFVCGRARDDSFRIFAGEVEGRELVASTWTPPGWTADEDGNVRPELVWAALDCPTYFAAHLGQDLSMSFLVRLAARLDAPVKAKTEHVMVAWPIEHDGRKRRAGSAVMTAAGEPLAVADALLVEARG